MVDGVEADAGGVTLTMSGDLETVLPQGQKGFQVERGVNFR